MQYGRPTSTFSLGNFTDQDGGTTDIHLTLDETPYDDADYVKRVGNNSSCQFILSAVTDPSVHTGHVVNFRMYATGAGAPEKMTFTLRQGLSTDIAVLANQQSDGVWGAKQLVLTEEEAGNITDYSDLRIYINTTQTDPDETRCSFIEFVCPDAAPAGGAIITQFQGSNLGADLNNGAII